MKIKIKTSKNEKPFAGRLIFDHLPKTAGQAVNLWLSEKLGDGCVTPNIIGQHRELIRVYGGEFSVISGHVSFNPGDTLDPRYHYATMLRDPIDRVISWLFFVTKNHNHEDLPHLFTDCLDFIESDGELCNKNIIDYISDIYVKHFSVISSGGGGEANISDALRALKMYDIVGTYEDIPRFTNDLAALIGIPAPVTLAPFNVTKSRPTVKEVSPRLRNKITELNKLDLEFYAAVRRMISGSGLHSRQAPSRSKWRPLEKREPRITLTDSLTVYNVEMEAPQEVREGGVITFTLDFEAHRPIARLEAGVHIFDAQGRWAFGVNSTMLGQDYLDVLPGCYRLRYHIIARLPLGAFTAGFAFAELAGEQSESISELFWHDACCNFSVSSAQRFPGIGYSTCPVSLSLLPTL